MATELKPSTSTLINPCIVFALRRESMYFRRTFRHLRKQFPGAQKPFSDAPCLAQIRQPREDEILRSVVMLETGVGAAATTTALSWCLSRPRCDHRSLYRPAFVLSAGFSGALQPEQRVGDLVLATEVVDPQGNNWPTFCPKALANRNVAAGRVLTMPELVDDPREKQRLGRQYQAIAVDMESAVAARLCAQHHVPFACLRVISDDWETVLSPHLIDLLRQGRVSVPRLAARVVRHIKLIGELWRLAGQTRLAARRLLEPLTTVIFSGNWAGDCG
jgi:nucleoside phosphorylase